MSIMEYSFSSWHDDKDFVLKFSDDECGDTIDDYYDDERILRESNKWNKPQLTHDYTQLDLETCCGCNDSHVNQSFEGKRDFLADEISKKRKFSSEHLTLPKCSPEKFQKSCLQLANDNISDKIINFSTLIDQLFNAKVVIEKMRESSGKNEQPEKNRVLSNGLRVRDSVQRYCPKCKTLQADKQRVTVQQSCPECKTTMRYLCSKCNSKHYRYYESLSRHWKNCDPACRKLNPSDFIVEEANLELTKEINRYCLSCNEINESCLKSKKVVCRKCDNYLLFQCKKCKVQYAAYGGLKYHLRNKCHPSHYKCNQCDFTNPSWDGMLRHINNVHRGTETYCPKCGKDFKSINYLKSHLKYCTLESNFSCACCPFETKHKHSLKGHMRTVHGK